jgi:hypothetical protein
MAVREDEIEETDEQKILREQQEREEAEAAREEELAAEREKTRKAELEAATARGEAEALKRGINPQPAAVTPWTEEQWEEEAARQGTTKENLKATIGIASAIADSKTKEARDEAAAAREEARQAREEAKRARSEASLSKIEEKFYKENPAMASRQRDVEDYLADLDPSIRQDPEKFKKALEKAKVYVRGVARDNVNTRRSASGAAGAGASRTPANERPAPIDDREEIDEEEKLDVSDLDNEGAQNLIRRLHREPGPDHLQNIKPLDELEIDEAFKQCERKDGRGVAIDERGEWKRGFLQRDRELKKR